MTLTEIIQKYGKDYYIEILYTDGFPFVYEWVTERWYFALEYPYMFGNTTETMEQTSQIIDIQINEKDQSIDIIAKEITK